MTLTFRSDIVVTPRIVAGTDADIATSAWASSKDSINEEMLTDKRVKGLLNSLMRDRHGCYDEQTEVLTERGWVFWKDARDDDRFITRNLRTNMIEYQESLPIIRKSHQGTMIRIKHRSIDLLVTEDHKMVASTYRGGWDFYTTNLAAKDLLDNAVRIPISGGTWEGAEIDLSKDELEFVGFFLADGHTRDKTGYSFRIHKSRKVGYLKELVTRIGLTMTNKDDKYYVHKNERLDHVLQATYNADKSRVVPTFLMDASRSQIRSLLDGFVMGDGSINEQGKVTISTSSKKLADQLQELLLKVGSTAKIQTSHVKNYWSGEDRTIYRMIFHRSDRTISPKIGWNAETRSRMVSVEEYEGMVYCATVPNGTLYVRRNGKATWCGNSPFDEGFLSVYIEAPRAVRDEHVRHRNLSYSSSSLRYTLTSPEVYIPSQERPLKKAEGFKQIRPKYERLTDEEYAEYVSRIGNAYESSKEGIDSIIGGVVDSTEAVRWITTDGHYVHYIARGLLRPWLQFLQLRTHEETANHPSHPMWEIEQVARKIETIIAEHWPLTYEAWVANGRDI